MDKCELYESPWASEKAAQLKPGHTEASPGESLQVNHAERKREKLEGPQ